MLLNFAPIIYKITKMRKHPVRKFLGLTVLYAVVIVGIFVLQFKTESVFTKTFGELRVSMAQTETKNQETVLKNQLQANFKGLTFVANSNNPATVSNSAEEGSSTNLVLASWKELNPNSVEFGFTDGSTLTFSVSDSTPNAFLTISAAPSGNNNTLSIVCKTAGGYSIKEASANRMILSTRDKMYSLNAPRLEHDRIVFTKESPLASYTAYDPSKHFEFTAAAGIEGSDANTYTAKVEQLKTAIVTQFEHAASSSQISSITEKEITAYVAEMCSHEKYNKAIDTVPSSFKQGNKRTYLSVPYFAGLVAMDETLVSHNQRLASLVQSAIQGKNPDIFTVEGISDYILREKKKPSTKTLLSIPATMASFEPTVSQAFGLITVYAKIYKADPDTAALLASAIEPCTKVIQENTKLEEGIITVAENDIPLNSVQAVEAGWALIQLGRISSRPEIEDTGRLLANQNLTEATLSNLQSLAELYPLLAENKFYPHTQILGYYGSECVWAWTCASSIRYSLMPGGVVNINVDFPLTYSHYILMKGVPTFHANIEIQGLRFRTDPRFEFYNSSGYVYNEVTKTFYLKSRHKSQVELVRLFCDRASNFTEK